MRGAVYYDGFNLYHAVDELNKPYLKWCNLWRLGELVAKGHAKTIEKAVFCTAYFPGDHGKRTRHEAFVNALALVGVETKLGHTTKEPMQCAACDHQWDQKREKETDINLALSIFDDAYQDIFDVAFVVTADTDQAGTFRHMRDRFPEKRIINVVPIDYVFNPPTLPTNRPPAGSQGLDHGHQEHSPRRRHLERRSNPHPEGHERQPRLCGQRSAYPSPRWFTRSLKRTDGLQ